MTASILVVEDNRANLSLMEYLLRAFGYTPLLATSAAEGVRVASEQRPDLILMDIQMPEMDGYDATAAIRSHPDLSETRVVAVTSFAMAGDAEHILASGFDGYMSKPILPEKFVEEVESFLPKDRQAARRDADQPR